MPRARNQLRKKAVPPGPPKPEAIFPTSLLNLPPELRFPIISKLSLSDALNLRLTCHTLNQEVVSFYPRFQLNITGDSLTLDQLAFLKLVHLKRITFKRVAKPMNGCPTDHEDDKDSDHLLLPSSGSSPCWSCTRRKVYSGPCQYFQVGGIQIRSLTAPERMPTRNCGCGVMREISLYNYDILRKYLLSIGSDDIFKHV